MGEEFVVTTRDVYDLVQKLDTKVDTYMHSQAPRDAVIEYRLAQLEKQGERRWMLYLALLGAAAALIAALVPLVVK
jgi:tetrahydromethanopterin S-methyltransferase subunit B